MTACKVDHIKSIYDSRASLPSFEDLYRADVDADISILKHFGLSAQTYVCDVGCGRGYHIRRLNDLGYERVWGIDVSAESLDRRLERAVCGDVRIWGVKGFFDICCSFLACIGAGSFEDDLGYVSAMASISKPGAVVVITSFCAELASSLVGEYTVRYDVSDPCWVHSSVSYASDTQQLLIQQATDRNGVSATLPNEKLTLRTRAEMMHLAETAGLTKIDTFLPGESVADGLLHATKGRLLLVGRNGG